MATFSATANVVEWTSVDDPSVVFRFVASAASGGGGGVSDHGALTGLDGDDHAHYALTDGSRGSFATEAQGALADTAVQIGDELRVVDAPSDDATTTTLTATDGVLEADVVRVLDSSPPGARGTVIVPHPSEWPNQSLLLVGDDHGASFGYWDAGGGWVQESGAADVTVNLDGDSDVTLDGCTLEFDDWTPSPGDAAAAQWLAAGAVTGDVTSVTITNIAVNGSPVDAMVGVAIVDAANDPVEPTSTRTWGTAFSNGADVQIILDTPVDVTGVKVTVYVISTGGGFVAPTSITFDAIYWGDDSIGRYNGLDNFNQGVGELNPTDPLGPYTHTWFDNPGIPAKSLHVFSDGAQLWTEHVPPRWEWVMGYTPPISGPLDGLKDVQSVVAAANQALVDQSTADGITVGTLDGNLVAVSEGTVEDVVQAVDDLALGGTPDAHAASHEDGGTDELALDASQITSGQLDIARMASGTPDGTKFVRDDGTLATPAGGGGDWITWTEVAQYVTVHADDWPEFVGVPDADWYRVRIWSSEVSAAATTGGLPRDVTVHFDSDTTSGAYKVGTTFTSSSDTKWKLGTLGQGGGGFATTVMHRAVLFGPSHVLFGHSDGVGSAGVFDARRSLMFGGYSPGSATRLPLSKWTFGISGSGAWAPGITFAIDTGVVA